MHVHRSSVFKTGVVMLVVVGATFSVGCLGRSGRIPVELRRGDAAQPGDDRPPPKKLFQTFLVRINGSALQEGEEVTLARYDLLQLHRFHSDDIRDDSWAAVRAINPQVEIYVTQSSHTVDSNADARPLINLTDLGRFGVSRGHSMGDLDNDNPGFFLLDTSSSRMLDPGSCTSCWILDFGNPEFQRYWIEGTVTDVVGHPWTADGVALPESYLTPGATPASPTYPTAAAWATAMGSFIEAVVGNLASVHQKLWVSGSRTQDPVGRDAWLALDASESPPDVMYEVAAFVTRHDPGDDASFRNETNWRQQVDLMGEMHHAKVAYHSNTDLAPGESGIDNYGRDVTYWDVVWYALGSYLIGKNEVANNSYLSLAGHTLDLTWPAELDELHLGSAVAPYQVIDHNGHNVYLREFEVGYVAVNPTTSDAADLPLPEPCKVLNHDNFQQPLAALPSVTNLSLSSHRAVVLMK
ncbi:putative glycoside hydrolase [Myxococcota bacterium]